MPKSIFVIGLDDINLETMCALPDADDYAFHGLLTIEELRGGDDIPFAELIEKATRQLESFEGTVDAIVGYWDFPVSSMLPILAKRFGVCCSTLESRVKCEHKYWARVEQSKVISEHPAFVAVDPFDDASVAAIDLSYPYWIKPVKSFSSELAEKVTDESSLEKAVAEIREQVGRVGQPFEYVMSQVDELPPEIAELGGRACVAEEEVSGELCTVEGYRRGDKIEIYGLFDSVVYPGTSSFLRFQYPSWVPEPLQERMRDITRRVIQQVDLDHSTFNVEFFWDETDGSVNVLEINPRHSQSHAPLLQHVDGVANHQAMIALALEQDPQLPQGAGPYDCAAKWFLRSFVDDGVVPRVPSDEDVRALEERAAGTTIKVLVEEGDRLAALHGQDTDSYKLAEVFVGASDHTALVDKYELCLEGLPFEIDELSEN